MQVTGIVTELESLLGEFVSTEVRLGVSVVVVAIALGASGLVIPRLVAHTRRLTADVTQQRFGDRVAEAAELIEELIPVSLIVTVLVRLIQLLLFIVAVLAVLVVWELGDAALWVVGLLETAIPLISKLLITGGLVIVAGLVNNVLQDVIGDFTSETSHVTAHQEQILTRVGQVALLVALLVGVLTVWNIQIGGILVGAGFLGIVVGMAARQTLGSLIAGFVLMFARPFEIGDWVAVGDNQGIVTKITIMNTHLRNFDGEHVVIPNDNVGEQAVINRSRDGKLRVHVEVGVDYDADPQHAAELAREAVDEASFVDGNPQPQVFPVKFGGSSVHLDVRFWISPPTPQKRWRATAEVIEVVKGRFDTESIDIPFPQRTVGHRGSGEERPVDRQSTIDAAD